MWAFGCLTDRDSHGPVMDRLVLMIVSQSTDRLLCCQGDKERFFRGGRLQTWSVGGYLLAMRLGEKIVAIARQRRMDLQQVAKKAGIPYNTLRGYTKSACKRGPSAAVGLHLAQVLDVPPGWLFDDSLGLPAPPHSHPPFPIHPWPPDITWEQLEACLLCGLAGNRATYIATAVHGPGAPLQFDAAWLGSLPPETLADLCRREPIIKTSLQSVADRIKAHRKKHPPT